MTLLNTEGSALKLCRTWTAVKILSHLVFNFSNMKSKSLHSGNKKS